MLQDIFKAILVTSFIGTALTLVLTLIKPITKKCFTTSWHYYMWLVVLVVMLIPIRISLPNQMQPAPVLESNSQITEEKVLDVTYEPIQVIEQDLQLNPDKEGNTYSRLENLKMLAYDKINVVAFVWFVGVMVLFLCKLVGYMIFLIKLRKYSDVISCPELMRFTNKKIVTRTSDKISSPLMIGLFKPTLLLPKTAMTPEQLDNVLAHEMTHFKRKDILYKWFISIVKCIHWFNPVIYYINKQVNIECEISCDLAVVKEMSEEQEICYINTILTLLAAGNLRTAALTTGMTSDKKTLKKRFTMIKNKVKISKKAMVISIVLALVILCGTVLASGLLNGKFINEYENELLAVNTDAREKDNFNFLILGIDEQNRADTIMVLSFEDGNVTGISIPRDTGFISKGIDRKVKLSEILNSENGDQKVIDAVKETLSIPVTYYAKVKLYAVKEIVDSVGGIELDVPMDMEYDDPHKDLHIKVKQGRHTLNGDAVCGLLQFRRSNDGFGYSDGDMTRIEVGQQFIMEFINQKLNKEFVNKSPDIFKILADNIDTNYPISNILNDIRLLDKMKSNIKFRTISGTLKTDDNGIVFYDVDSGEIFSATSHPALTPSSEETQNKATGMVREKNAASENKNTGNSGSNYTALNIPTQNTNETKIKSTSVSKEPYTGFEQLALKNADLNKIQQELHKQGIVESKKSSVDLSKNYVVKDYSSEQTKVVSDENGNISLYLSVNSDNLFDVRFYDAETSEDVGSYGVLANNENAYTFIGFEKGKTYNVEVQGQTKDDWSIEGNYIIY